MIVYDAPNDYTGQAELDEYTAIANQDVASTISPSWGFGCIRSDGTTIVDQADPASQPWVTSVGGTSLEADNSEGLVRQEHLRRQALFAFRDHESHAIRHFSGCLAARSRLRVADGSRS